MPNNDFLEERRRRQQELIAIKKARQNIEPLPAEESKEIVPTTATDKAKNFWFYNKYFVIFGLIMAVILTVVIKQCATREKYDAQVVLFAYSAFTPEQISVLEYQLEQYYEDLNGDGKSNIQIIDCSYAKSANWNQYQSTMMTKLTANISSNAEAMLYITDAESTKYLEGLFETGFFESESVALPRSFYKAVEKRTDGMFTLPEGLLISRRKAGSDTVVGKEQDIESKIKAADAALAKIASAS